MADRKDSKICGVCLGGLEFRVRLPSTSWLHHFAAAGAMGSFAGAAHQLGVTRGSISQSIVKLEDYVGARLFDRAAHSSQASTLTAAGRLALPTATQIVYLAASMGKPK